MLATGLQPMTRYKVDHLKEQLSQLKTHSPAIIGSMILSSDGFPIAEDLPLDLELGDERIAARSAAIFALGDRIAWELRRGKLEQLFIGGKLGLVIVTFINSEAALTVLCREDVRIAMLLLDMSYAVEQLRALL